MAAERRAPDTGHGTELTSALDEHQRPEVPWGLALVFPGDVDEAQLSDVLADKAHMKRYALRRSFPVWLLILGLVFAASLVFFAFRIGIRLGHPILVVPYLGGFFALRHFLRRLPPMTGLEATLGTAGEIGVGADGVLIQKKRRHRFIPFASVADVRAQGLDRVRVFLADGSVETLGCEDSEELETAIADARRAFHEAANDSARRPGARPEALTEGSFRDRPITEEDIVRIAADLHADEEDRLAAVATLASTTSSARAKLRVAIEQTAEPVLRAALESALAGRNNEGAAR